MDLTDKMDFVPSQLVFVSALIGTVVCLIVNG